MSNLKQKNVATENRSYDIEEDHNNGVEINILAGLLVIIYPIIWLFCFVRDRKEAARGQSARRPKIRKA